MSGAVIQGAITLLCADSLHVVIFILAYMSISTQMALLQHLQGDNRFSSDAVIITHDRTELKAKSVLTLSEAENAAYSYDIIGIDEGQFLPGDLLQTCCLSTWILRSTPTALEHKLTTLIIPTS